jgi:hypothetical protein
MDTKITKRKRGNPRPKKLTSRILLSFSPNDMQVLKERAKLKGVKLAAFIREKALFNLR